ncbi:MAG: SpoIIE family protein phosphatase [Candidatus Poribacteria bacterium]|nr:SpoIIE family protein phosphatase [Candidatus Poribacteria bacterium]
MAETILVVDDDLDILQLLRMNLEPDGYEVRTASDGKQAVETALLDPPDLILLDVMMPQKDGFQVIEELKNIEETKTVPVILLTARGQTEDKVQGLDAGADDYITKPFDLREVSARVKAVLGRTQPIKYINPLMSAMGSGFNAAGVQQLAGHLQAAAAIQKKLLPEQAPSFQGFDIGMLLQSSMSVSGDFYDFIPLSETRIGIVLGDVKGNGIPASLLMVMIRTALRLLCREEEDPASILKRINDLVVRDTDATLFATMIYGVMDTVTSTFTYSNGGHCYPLHRKKTGAIDVLKTGSMLVGAFEEATFASNACLLTPGDIVVFYTDGITETNAADDFDLKENEKVLVSSEEVEEVKGHQSATPLDVFYGQDRLAGCISENAVLPASALCEAIVEDLVRFSGSTQTHDDRALVVIKRDT